MFEYFKKKKPSKENDHVVVQLAANDPALQTFTEKAQEELPYLIDFMNSHEKDDELFRYAVKANFIEDDDSEHMWVQVNEFKDGCFIGRLANEPAQIQLANATFLSKLV